MTSTAASAIRPSLRDNRQLSGSPHTPSRFIPSTFSSPGSSFRQEEDAIIIELDCRSLKAGFEGESGPQCVIPFSPENARRVGDYRTWLPDYKRPHRDVAVEAASYELWRNDLSDLDLGLMEDRLERAVREAYNKHLLTDAGTARLVLVLPSLVPLTVLSSMLTMLFDRWKYTTIAMLPAPTMGTLAAGLRSSLVIDIGWEESVVTPVYEYRELTPRRSTRGMKKLVEAMANMLGTIAGQQTATDADTLRLDFEFVEDFVTRMAFCNPASSDVSDLTEKTQDLSIGATSESSASTTIAFDWPCHTTSQPMSINTHDIATAVDEAFFGVRKEPYHDDHEQSLDHLVYQTLLRLPPDIRGVCMSRLVFCGQGANVLGIRSRIMEGVMTLMGKHGWSAVRGEKVKSPRVGLVEIPQGRTASADFKHNVNLPPGKDFVDEKLFKQKAKGSQPATQGVLRCVETLGAWTGASLLTSLKLKGVVEVERDRFLSHGLSGASREQDVNIVSQRPSTVGVSTAKGVDKASWTLAGWGSACN